MVNFQQFLIITIAEPAVDFSPFSIIFNLVYFLLVIAKEMLYTLLHNQNSDF